VPSGPDLEVEPRVRVVHVAHEGDADLVNRRAKRTPAGVSISMSEIRDDGDTASMRLGPTLVSNPGRQGG
jgi:hypothetical protein